MDILKKAAMEFDKLLPITYHFEVARRNVKKEFSLSFKPEDFHHITGLHKLKDIELAQSGMRSKIYHSVLNGHIAYSDISKSNYFNEIAERLRLVGDMEKIIDSNQIIFKYLENVNRHSLIEADFLLENAHRMNIVYLFLSERTGTSKAEAPCMFCRSLFPMDKMDYSKNQPSYTLLKKIKTDAITGASITQYDRKEIMAKIQKNTSEPERKSILQQLNENKAQQAINDALSKRATIPHKTNEHMR